MVTAGSGFFFFFLFFFLSSQILWKPGYRRVHCLLKAISFSQEHRLPLLTIRKEVLKCNEILFNSEMWKNVYQTIHVNVRTRKQDRTEFKSPFQYNHDDPIGLRSYFSLKKKYLLSRHLSTFPVPKGIYTSENLTVNRLLPKALKALSLVAAFIWEFIENVKETSLIFDSTWHCESLWGLRYGHYVKEIDKTQNSHTHTLLKWLHRSFQSLADCQRK